MQSKVKRILIQYAMEKEGEPLLAWLQANGKSQSGVGEALDPGFSMRGFEFTLGAASSAAGGTSGGSGSKDALTVAVTLAGKDLRHQVDAIGSIPAALQAFIGIKKYSPDLMINAGTCGGYESQAAKIGEVFIGKDQTAFHDRRVAIPKFDQAARAEFSVGDPRDFGIELSHLKRARVSTGDSLDCPPMDQEQINKNGGTLKEMEAAAIAYVAAHEKVPLILFKGVTDFVDHPAPTAEQFFANYEKTAHNVAHEVIQFLTALAGR